MAVATFPGERWEASEGAPMGFPSFDLHVPSSSDPDTVYRIIRDHVTEVIIHKPMCPAWRHGHRNCRHLKAAITRAGQPAQTFLEAVGALYDTTTWWAQGEVPPVANDLLVAVKLALDEARAQIERNEAEMRTRAKSDAFNALPSDEAMAQAVRDFG